MLCLATMQKGATAKITAIPPALAHSITRTYVIPAAVFLPKIIRQLRQIEAFVRVHMRHVNRAHNDVWPGSHIGGHCALWAKVFNVHTFNLDGHLGLLSKSMRIG